MLAQGPSTVHLLNVKNLIQKATQQTHTTNSYNKQKTTQKNNKRTPQRITQRTTERTTQQTAQSHYDPQTYVLIRESPDYKCARSARYHV